MIKPLMNVKDGSNLRINKTNEPVAGLAAESSVEFSKCYQEFVAGYLAACTSICILFPFNKIIFRQILHGVDARDAYRQLHAEGLSKLYRGLLPPLLQKSTTYSIMFGTQHQYYLYLKLYFQNNHKNGIKSELFLNGLSAFFAGLTEATLTPFERVQAVLQIEKYHDTYKNTFHAFRDIVQKDGVRELYRGLSAICIRNSLSNTLFFTTRKPLKELFPKAQSEFEHILYNFITGGVIGAVVSTIFYPMNVLKSHMQAKIGGEFTSIINTFNILYNSRERQLSSLFKGVTGNFWRAVFAWGITNSSFEFYLSRLRRN